MSYYQYISAAGAGLEGTIAGYLNANSRKKALSKYQPEYEYLPPVSSAQGEFMDQNQNMPAISDMLSSINSRDNAAYQAQLEKTSPNLVRDIGAYTTNAGSLARGELPQDVRDNITRSTAYQSLQNGFAGSPMAHGLTARDIGRTSVDLMQQGGQMLGQGMSLTRGVNPENLTAGGTLMMPHDILARNDAQAYYNNKLANQAKIIKATGQAISPWGEALASGVSAYTANLKGGSSGSMGMGGGGGGSGGGGSNQQSYGGDDGGGDFGGDGGYG